MKIAPISPSDSALAFFLLALTFAAPPALAGGTYGRAKDPTLAVEEAVAMAKVYGARQAEVDASGKLVPYKPGKGLQANDTILRRPADVNRRADCTINVAPVATSKSGLSSRPTTVSRGTNLVVC